MRNTDNKIASFKKLAANRTNKVIKNLHLIGNLSNRNNYSFTESDFKQIFDAIEKELKLTKARFTVVFNKNNKFRL